jgi:hypothetical protein
MKVERVNKAEKGAGFENGNWINVAKNIFWYGVWMLEVLKLRVISSEKYLILTKIRIIFGYVIQYILFITYIEKSFLYFLQVLLLVGPVW